MSAHTPPGGASNVTSAQPFYMNMEISERVDTPRRSPTGNASRARAPGGARARRGVSHTGDLQYDVDDIPPWYLSLLLGFQHYIIMFGATVMNALVVSTIICVADTDAKAKSDLISTLIFVSGVGTVLQSTIGTRLPIVQGGSFSYVAPIQAIMKLPKWQCPSGTQTAVNPAVATIMTSLNVTRDLFNTSDLFTNVTTLLPEEEPWKPRIREIQGAIIVASVIHTLLGLSGVIGFALRYIGPLSITPTIALVGLSLFEVASDVASKQWWITLVTVLLIVAFSQYSKNINVPCFTFKRGRGWRKSPFPLFRLFPVILAIWMSWLICAILTFTGVFPKDSSELGFDAKTNVRIDVLKQAAWFRMPYPGQWGRPTVSASSVFGIFAAVLASIFESLGDYYACARMSGVPPPPTHALNRGIAVEGLGCIIAGLFGSGSAITSYSENVGAIGITKVASRRVIQVCGVLMIVFGMFGKVGALFVAIPEPVVGGVFIVMFGMITAIGISNLQFVDLNSSRNLFIIGFSFFFGLTLPKYITEHPGCIQTGNKDIDQIITVLLSTNMFVGGLSGFVLDNTIPGSDAERGLVKWRQQLVTNPASRRRSCYDMPRLTALLRRWPATRYVPFLPSFTDDCAQACKSRKSTAHADAARRRASEQDVTSV